MMISWCVINVCTTLMPQNVCTVVSKSLENLSDAHKADVCINYLDGYISWLPEKYRKPFVESILETKASLFKPSLTHINTKQQAQQSPCPKGTAK